MEQGNGMENEKDPENQRKGAEQENGIEHTQENRLILIQESFMVQDSDSDSEIDEKTRAEREINRLQQDINMQQKRIQQNRLAAEQGRVISDLGSELENGMEQSHLREEDMRNKLHEAEKQITEKQMEISIQRRELEMMKQGNQGKARMAEMAEEMKRTLKIDPDNSQSDEDEDSETSDADPDNLLNVLKAKDMQVSKLLQVLGEQSNKIEESAALFKDLNNQLSDSDEKLVNQRERMDKQKQALLELIELVTEQSRELESFKQEHHPETVNEANNLVGHASWLANAEDNINEREQGRMAAQATDKQERGRAKRGTSGGNHNNGIKVSNININNWKQHRNSGNKNNSSNTCNSTTKTRSNGNSHRTSEQCESYSSNPKACSNPGSSRGSRAEGYATYMDRSGVITEIAPSDPVTESEHEYKHSTHQSQSHTTSRQPPAHYVFRNNILCSMM